MLTTKNLKHFLHIRGVYTSSTYDVPIDQIIILNKAEYLPE
jgi:hypothetical protein